MNPSHCTQSVRCGRWFPSVLLGTLLGMFTLAASAAESSPQPFDVARGPAKSTLREFARQAGIDIFYTVDTIAGVDTDAIKGTYAVSTALALMLANTDLTIVQDEKTSAYAIKKRGDSDTPAAPSSNVPDSTSSRGAPSANNEITQLDAFDVTVSVQKRPQPAQDVPISMTALSARSLERMRVDDLRDLSRLTPNLLVSAFNLSNPTIAIRGASNTFSQIGVSKPVVVVIDDVYLSRITASSFDLFDLDSVQVLRGPQGTLFGRNVTGGAIIFNTTQPSLTTAESAARLDYGNYGAVRVQGMVSGPVSEHVAGKVTVSKSTRDGYGRDRLTGRAQDDQDSLGVRTQLLVQPSAHVKALLSFDYSKDTNGGRTLSSVGVGDDGDRRTSELGYPQDYHREMWGVSGRVDWTTESGDFTSITAYRESRSFEDYSGVGASYTLLTSGSQSVVQDSDHPGTFTQELRFASPKWEHFDYVGGVYLLAEDAYRYLANQAFAARTGNLVLDRTTFQQVDTLSYAAYLDGTYHLDPAWDVTLGARFTVDHKETDVTRIDAFSAAGSFSATGEEKEWSEFTPRAVLTWKPGENLRLYTSVTRGFTAGGFNTEAASLAILRTPFDPETVTNYEIGLKSQFFDRRLRLNLALFDQRYSDKQELYFNVQSRILNIVNASEATMQGAELEVVVAPARGLNLTFGYGYLEATYDRFEIPGVLNYTGNPLGSAPRNKVSLGFDYEYALGARGFLFTTASYAWTDDYYTGASKDPNLFVPAYSLANASFGYQTADRRWRASLWVKNLQDTEYLLTPSTQGVLAEYLGEPRTYGVSIGYHY